jgi:transcription initiation factor TFIID TATA-box-binding protein
VVFRHSAPRFTALVFGSGKIVLTGLADPEIAPSALEAVLGVIRDAGAVLDEPVPAPKVVNLVASGSLGGRVLLHRLAVSRNFDRVEFDPEQFPGLVYRPEAGGVALIFGTGSVIVTGVRSFEGAREGATEVRSIIDASSAWASG